MAEVKEKTVTPGRVSTRTGGGVGECSCILPLPLNFALLHYNLLYHFLKVGHSLLCIMQELDSHVGGGVKGGASP